MKEDTPKPTTALEYRFARRSTGDDKAVANVWELGGNSQLSELLKVVLLELAASWRSRSTSRTRAMRCPRSPSGSTRCASRWRHACAARGPAGAATADEAQQLAASLARTPGQPGCGRGRAGGSRPQVRPIEANFSEPENRKVLTRCLRYFCRVNGASLVTKHKDKAMMTTCATCSTTTSFTRRPSVPSSHAATRRPASACDRH